MALAQFQSLFAAAAELPLESSDPAVLHSAALGAGAGFADGVAVSARSAAGVTVAVIGPEPTSRKPTCLAVFLVRSQV